MVAENLLGSAFRLLFNEVKKIKDNNLIFGSALNNIDGTLESLKPLIEESDQLNKEFDLQPPQLILDYKSEMNKGAELVQRCSMVHPCNFFMKSRYTDQLLDLDKTLNKLRKKLPLMTAIYVMKNLGISQKMYNQMLGANGSHNIETSSQITLMVSCQVPKLRPDMHIVGLDLPLKELKKRLLRNGESLLVVTAPGGFGKTLLSQKFCLDDKVKDKFKENIFFITVSKKQPSLSLLVQSLYKYKTNVVPDLPNEEVALNYLEQFLNQLRPNPALLVLDDVWPGSESLVQKFVFKIPDYKILVTSRFQFPIFHPAVYHLNALNDKDAMSLFRHCAALEDSNSKIPHRTVKGIVDYYKEIPFALEIVAQSLKGQRVELWEKTLKECCGDSSTLPLEKKRTLSLLQSSFDDLNHVVKECFMDLGLFPKGQRIPVAALIDMWIELYKLEEDSDAIVILSDLARRNLTRKDLNEGDDYYGDHFVTQLHFVRDLAVHQSSMNPVVEQRKRLIMDINGDNYPKWLEDHKEQPLPFIGSLFSQDWPACLPLKEICSNVLKVINKQPQFSSEVLSISTDENFSSNWFDIQLPEVKILVLNFQTKDYDLPKFVTNMEKLRVLILTNCNSSFAELSNFQFLGCLKKLKRIRLQRVSIPHLSTTLVPLKNLQKISLFMCSIGEAFGNCCFQISDLFPVLKEMNVDFCNDLVKLPDGLCYMKHLEELSITNCPKLCALPKEIGKLENLKVLRLRSCINLKELPDSIRNISKLTFLDISGCISIQNLPKDIGNLQRLKKLNMNHCSGLWELPSSFSCLEQLEELLCDEETEQRLCESFPYHIRKEVRLAKEDINLDWLRAF